MRKVQTHAERVGDPHRIGASLTLAIMVLSLPSQVFAGATIEPHYTHTKAHGSVPTSIGGMTDSYEIQVTNGHNVSVTGVIVYIPTDFELINESASEVGWVARRLPAQPGVTGGVSWNGREILPGMSATFFLSLRNPDVGLFLPAVETFLIVQTYPGGASATREPVEITYPTRLFGIDYATLAFTLVAVVFLLLSLDVVSLRGRQKTVTTNS